MFELLFLGTSASAPSIQRGLPAAMVFHKEYRFLIDCGEGTQRQILKAGVGFRRLDRVLLTHGHLDHILGLAGLVSTFGRWESIDRLEIYGGAWALERVQALMRVVFGRARPKVRLELVDLAPGVVLEDATFRLTAFPVTHRGPGCFGFNFEEKPRRPFLAAEADALGVPAGPERGRLVRGEPVVLADGRTVFPDQVLGPEQEGTKLTFVGDASRVDDLVEPAGGADALVIEATYTQMEADVAREFGHLTAHQAASLARDAGAAHLVLTHLSRRYGDHEILQEAQALSPSVFVARDFDRFQVRRGQPLEKIPRD